MTTPPRPVPPSDRAFRLDTQLISDIWVFQVVGTMHGMAAAARRLGISQGAVSQRIARLEARLGAELFARKKTGLELTVRGEHLFRAAERAMTELGAGLAYFALEPIHNIVVNCTPSLAYEWLVPALQRFESENPGVSVEVNADQAAITRARLDNEGIHIAFRYAPNTLSDVVELAAVPEYVFPVCAPDDGAQPRRCARRLHDQTPWEGAGPDAEWRDWSAAAGAEYELASVSERRFNLASLAYEAAEEKQGTALGRAGLVRDRLNRGTLVPVSQSRLASAQYRIVSNHEWPPRSPIARFVLWAVRDLKQTQEDTLALLSKLTC